MQMLLVFSQRHGKVKLHSQSYVFTKWGYRVVSMTELCLNWYTFQDQSLFASVVGNREVYNEDKS